MKFWWHNTRFSWLSHRLSLLFSFHSRLIHDREMQLYDGTRLLHHEKYEAIKSKEGLTDSDMQGKGIHPIHPSFRIVALAEPPVVGAAQGQWLTPEGLTLFLYHTMRPLSPQETINLVTNLVSSLNLTFSIYITLSPYLSFFLSLFFSLFFFLSPSLSLCFSFYLSLFHSFSSLSFLPSPFLSSIFPSYSTFPLFCSLVKEAFDIYKNTILCFYLFLN